MAAASRSVPRFLPTLTEVVQAPPQRRSAQVNAAPPKPGVDELAIAQTVLGQIEAEMESLFRDTVAAALLEQVDAIAARLRGEIEPVLRQAVADMVAHEIAARRHV